MFRAVITDILYSDLISHKVTSHAIIILSRCTIINQNFFTNLKTVQEMDINRIDFLYSLNGLINS